jgi:hypothetical protein
MFMLYLSLFVVALFVSIVNIYFAKIDNPTIITLIKGSLYMLPFQYIVSLGYAYYYSEGIKTLSYLALNISAFPILLVFGISSHYIFFKSHTFTVMELLGIIFTLMGMIFFYYK